ncbi:hypothetical protein GGU10DRAFT_233957, partial [Lentinula aff. detonsa]
RGWSTRCCSDLEGASMTPAEKPLSSFPVDEARIFISTSYPKELTTRWALKLRGFDTLFEF